MTPIGKLNIGIKYVYKEGILYTVNPETMVMTADISVGDDGHVYTTEGYAYAHLIWIMHHATPRKAMRHVSKVEGFTRKETTEMQLGYEIAMANILRRAKVIKMAFKDGDILNCAIENLEPIQSGYSNTPEK